MHPLADQLDWGAEEDRAIALLRDLLRFDTSNPPGNEAGCATFLADELRTAGLEPELLEAAPSRTNLVTRLGGDGSLPPLLLNAHLDVVPAEADRWTHPPFGAELADGFVWGRGAVDMKNMAAMSAAVMSLLSRLGAPLRRDVIFAAVADEEAGCEHGSAWLVDHHPEKVRAEYALGEVGGFTLQVGRRVVYPVQVAEKGVCWLKVRAPGATGHGSMPRADNAVVRLAAFLTKVGRSHLPLHPSLPVQRFVDALAAGQPAPVRLALKAAGTRYLSSLITDRVIRDPSLGRMLSAILRNTASPTMLRAGTKINVIPGRAEAQLDGRIAVGSSGEELIAELRALGRPDLEFEVVKTHRPTAASPDTPMFAAIAEVVAEHHPGAVAVPSVIPGFTDAHYWSRLGTTCYGFSPVRLEPADGVRFADLFHGDDERVPVAGFRAGLRMLADVVLRVAS